MNSEAMVVPAPGRLSTTTWWPMFCETRALTARESTADTPPGGNPTTRRMGRLGYPCAKACALNRARAGTARAGRIMDSPAGRTRAEYRGKTFSGQRRDSGNGVLVPAAHVHEVGKQDHSRNHEAYDAREPESCGTHGCRKPERIRRFDPPQSQ